MKKVFAVLAVMILAASSWALDSLNVNDTSVSVAQQVILAHIDSLPPLHNPATVYIPMTYNKYVTLVPKTYIDSIGAIGQYFRVQLKNAAFRLPGNQKFVLIATYRVVRMDTSFKCPDPYQAFIDANK